MGDMKQSHQHDTKKLHSIDSFGILKVSLSNIRIERLEDRIKPGVPFPHKHDFFQIMMITTGKGKHRIDFTEHDVKPLQTFIMKPGQMHSWNLQKGIKGLIVEFNRESLNVFKDSAKLLNDLSYDFLNFYR
jgi:AraC family transcriptional regulator, transcriptional activator of pobA